MVSVIIIIIIVVIIMYSINTLMYSLFRELSILLLCCTMPKKEKGIIHTKKGKRRSVRKQSRVANH